MTIAIILFVGIPLLMALLAKGVYNLFFPLTAINKKSKQYDSEAINIPYGTDTIAKLRNHQCNHQSIGNKVVFTHHLAPQVNEFRKIVIRTLVKTLLFEFILLVVVSIGAASQNPTANTDLITNLNLIATQWRIYYVVPLGMVALIVEFIFYYNFLSEQISKYND